MFNISKDSDLGASEVMDKAVRYFGQNGIGLEMSEQPEGVRFVGGAGHVIVSVTPSEDGSHVILTGREWEYQAREFLDLV